MTWRRTILVTWITAVWVLLWGGVTFANVAGGIAVGVVLVFVFEPDRSEWMRFRPLAALRFLGFFGVRLVRASAVVGWEVATPRNRINEAIVAVPLVSATPILRTIVTGAISLTPGTVVLDFAEHGDTTSLFVHVLHFRSIEEVRLEVERLELLAARAFGTRRCIADMEALLVSEEQRWGS